MSDDRYAIFGDVHGNWSAFEAVLEDAKSHGINSFICVGDIVGYNADPVKCLEMVMEMGCVTVLGNHDYYCSHAVELHDFHPIAAEVIRWTRSRLSSDHLNFFKEMKFIRRFANVTVVHSTLDMPEKWGYVFDVLEADAHFNYQSTPVCVNGHTHIPVVFERDKGVTRKRFDRVKVNLGTRYFINVGSVGQPRDGDPRAAYAVYDSTSKVFELRRVEYDIQAAQQRIHEEGLPERLARRLEFGK